MLIEDLDQDKWDCPHDDCSSSFDSRRGMATHYGLVHDGSVSGYLVRCDNDNCEEKFRKRTENYDDEGLDFCSPECVSEWKGSEEWNEEYAGEKHSNWNGGDVTVCCDNCDETISRKRSLVEQYEHHFCDHDCKGEWASRNRRGANAPNYKGGGSSIYSRVKNSLGDDRWEDVSERVRDKSDRECEICGTEEWSLRKSLHVHHIVPLLAGGTNDDWNLMALCPSCHKKVESVTEEYVEYPLTPGYYSDQTTPVV